MRLYEIDEQIEKLIELNVDQETGEISPEVEADLKKLNIEKDRKIENMALIVKLAKIDSDIISKEIKRLQSMKNSLSNKQLYLRNAIKDILAGQKFKTHRVNIYYTSRQELVIDYEGLNEKINDSKDVATIEDFYEKIDPDLIKIEKSIKKTEMKNKIKSGVKLPFVYMESKSSIVIR